MIKEFNSIENGEVSTLHEPNNYGEMELIIKDRATSKKIRFRNVGNRNINSSLQFECQEFNIKTNRTKHFSFSVPLALVEIFIEHLTKVR